MFAGLAYYPFPYAHCGPDVLERVPMMAGTRENLGLNRREKMFELHQWSGGVIEEAFAPW